MKSFERGKYVIIPVAAAALAATAFFGLRDKSSEKTDSVTPTTLGSDAFHGPKLPETPTTLSLYTPAPNFKTDGSIVKKNGKYCQAFEFQVKPDELNQLHNFHQADGVRDDYDVDLYQFASTGKIALRIDYFNEETDHRIEEYIYPYNPSLYDTEVPENAHTKISEHGGTAEFFATEPAYGQFQLAAEFCGPVKEPATAEHV